MTRTSLPEGADASAPGAADASPEALASSLSSERGLLEELVETLRRQREAIADDDLDVVETTVHGVHRILVTLREARRGRRALIQRLTGDASTPLDDLDGALGPGMTDGLARARSELIDAAGTVSEELELNRRVLETALAANDELVRTLFDPDAGDEASTYGRDAGAASTGTNGGAYLDQRA